MLYGAMEAVDPRSADAPDESARRIVRRVGRRYAYVLAVVAGLVIIDQVILQPKLVHMNAFAPAINLAGRQRMLSQQVTKAALVLRDGKDDAQQQMRRRELGTTLARWTSEHESLRHGDTASGIIPIRSAALEREWIALEPEYRAMVTAAGTVLDSPSDLPLSSEATTEVDTLVEHEAAFLPVMDRIVTMMEDEAARVVRDLRRTALAIASLLVALLIGLGWFVVRPATQTIRSQIESLESRVAARTSELQTTLKSLTQEIREREEAEERNQKLSAQLTHAERVSTMGHLTAGLAHELNQPLAAATNYLETCDVLLDEAASTDPLLCRLQELAGAAKRSALRAGQIVKRMRNYARPNAAMPELVRLNSLVSEIVELCRTDVAASSAEINVVLGARDDTVMADPVQIQQVLVNLVHNAAQAIASSRVATRKISIRTADGEGRVQVDVIDTGPGFGELDAGRAFAPFCSTKLDGLGIGLAICRSIIEDHHGRIWIAQSAAEGTIVSFMLPLTAAHAATSRTPTDCLCD